MGREEKREIGKRVLERVNLSAKLANYRILTFGPDEEKQHKHARVIQHGAAYLVYSFKNMQKCKL